MGIQRDFFCLKCIMFKSMFSSVVYWHATLLHSWILPYDQILKFIQEWSSFQKHLVLCNLCLLWNQWYKPECFQLKYLLSNYYIFWNLIIRTGTVTKSTRPHLCFYRRLGTVSPWKFSYALFFAASGFPFWSTHIDHLLV